MKSLMQAQKIVAIMQQVHNSKEVYLSALHGNLPAVSYTACMSYGKL